jgi:hypothetical protein
MPLTEEASMVSIPKIISILSCGVLLGLGLTGNTASAADKMEADQSSERLGGQAGLESEEGQLKGAIIVEHAETIQGEVLRVEDANYFVKGQDGQEVRMHTDQTIQKRGTIRPGDCIEATVNDQNHALSIRSLP